MSSLFNFRRASALAAGLVVAAGSLAGCAAKNPLVGKWQNSLMPGVTLVMEFKPDGTDAMTVQGSNPMAKGQTFSQSRNGTYSVQGDTLTMTTAPDSAPGAAGQSTAPAPHSAKFKIEGDTLTLTGDKSPKPMVMTRVKD